MAASKALIVGLGNPGAAYEHTRHNIGFAVVDRLAEQEGLTYRTGQGRSLAAWGRLEDRAVGLIKPQTYMNCSGQTVQALLRYYDVAPDHLLVVVDDLNLRPGVLRARQRGSAGGHNGIQDIIDRLGSDAFPRLRIGIGNDFARGRQADFVLSRFSRDEQPVMEEAVARAADLARVFVREGVEALMNRANPKPAL